MKHAWRDVIRLCELRAQPCLQCVGSLIPAHSSAQPGAQAQVLLLCLNQFLVLQKGSGSCIKRLQKTLRKGAAATASGCWECEHRGVAH